MTDTNLRVVVRDYGTEYAYTGDDVSRLSTSRIRGIGYGVNIVAHEKEAVPWLYADAVAGQIYRDGERVHDELWLDWAVEKAVDVERFGGTEIDIVLTPRSVIHADQFRRDSSAV